MDPGPEAARALIAFYLDAGVDALLGEEAIDRMADQASAIAAAEPQSPGTAGRAGIGGRDAAARREPAQEYFQHSLSPSGERSKTPAPPPRSASTAPPPPPDAAIMAARDAAKNAASLDELQSQLERFEGCTLRSTATRLVFADGNPQARVMFVGEAPGYEEDMTGRPFVGPSGKLLDRMMEAIGLDRSGVYIANVVPWRPPGNRTPTPQETAICLPFIRRQIELADPDILVCLGLPATQTLLGTKEGITRTRGRWFKYDTGAREIRALATFHPAFLLRSSLQKRFAWRDFLAIKKALAG